MESSETVRCAPWTQANDPDPCGTAGEYDTILAIDVPGPWPTDVGEISDWWGGSDPAVRALAVLPADDGDRSCARVTAWRRTPMGPFVGTDYAFAGAAVSAEAIDAIAAGEAPPKLVAESPAPSEILVCGHGRRDRCCGNLGVRLEAQLVGRLRGVRVRRCSHLGGHRFAPTAITFPDGRWWAYLDTDVVERIYATDIDGDLLATHYRGLGGLGPAAQLVERQLFAERGASWNDATLSDVTIGPDPAGNDPMRSGAVVVRLAWHHPDAAGETTARVALGRSVPQIVCGSAGPVMKKMSTELRIDWLRTEFASDSAAAG